MSNKTLAISIGLVVVLGVGGYILYQQPDSDSDNAYVPTAATQQDSTATTPDSTTSKTTTAPAPTGSHTLAEVATHKDAASCWSAINGNVYDLTAWVPKHPGGEEAILGICGIDGSARFNRQHGGKSLQAGILAGYKIGALAQ
jgi:cytochrome b involved in lipid metabolism